MNMRLACMMLCASLLASLCLAHGSAYSVFHTATGIEATYDDGRPMASCEVSVFSPSAPGTRYQSGTTDPEGCFAFVPNTSGLWTLTVDDGQGHMVAALAFVEEEEAVHIHPRDYRPDHDHGHDHDLAHHHSSGLDIDRKAHARLNRPLGAIVGVSIIFGLFGVYCLARLSLRHSRPKPGCEGDDCGCTSPKE